MGRFWNYIKEKKEIFIKCIVLFAVAFLYLGRAFNDITPYPTGDGPEYIMTTEAVYNHFSSDIRPGDFDSFKKSYTRTHKWEDNYKYPHFDQMHEYFMLKDLQFMSQFGGVYVDKNAKNYGYHFFFYSWLNAPGRYIAEKIGANPLRCFQVTNAFFVIITCFFLLFSSPFALWQTVLIALSFCFSSAYWYLGWTHPEVYTVCLVTLGFWFFLLKRHYLGILLVAVAALQNQPLLVALVFMALKTMLDKGFNFKNIFRIFLSSVIFLWPAIFYYLHYNTTNLIKDAGFLSTEYITFTRVFGFYTDVNQGVVLVIPLILLLFVFFFIRKWVLIISKKEPFDFNYLFPVFLIIMTCVVSTMGNWNHGQAVVNRYASWFSAIVLIFTIISINQFRHVVSLTLMNYVFMTQAITTLYHDQFNLFDWSQDVHKPLAKWFIEEHPGLYNPDPTIFIVRTTRDYDFRPSASPVFYLRNKNEITKMAVHKDMVDSLVQYGFSKQEINFIKPKLHFINNWAYLNKGEFVCEKSGEEIYQILRNKKLVMLEDRIKSHAEWMEKEEVKSKEWKMPLNEILKIDAEYLLQQEENEK
ncbi:MAG TPA: hypothetical protein VNZ49_05710 [Bacteroidia bacterium]|jgi:hypothetical protein|nr:hypothetical protein [Bacteroidia bacterium]